MILLPSTLKHPTLGIINLAEIDNDPIEGIEQINVSQLIEESEIINYV